MSVLTRLAADSEQQGDIDHLFLGTPSDNVQDMIAKGRHKPPPHKDFCPRGHYWVGHESACRGPESAPSSSLRVALNRQQQQHSRPVAKGPTHEPVVATHHRRHRPTGRGCHARHTSHLWKSPGPRGQAQPRSNGAHILPGLCSNLHKRATGFRPGHAPSEGGDGHASH